MSSFNFEKTSFNCEGECPLPSLIKPPLFDSHQRDRREREKEIGERERREKG